MNLSNVIQRRLAYSELGYRIILRRRHLGFIYFIMTVERREKSKIMLMLNWKLI